MGAAVLGLIVHMMMSMVVGVAFFLGVRRVQRNAATLAGIGMVFGLVVWVVMQYLVWPIVDADAAGAFTPWVFAVGHVMFGAATGLVVAAPRKNARGRTLGHPTTA